MLDSLPNQQSSVELVIFDFDGVLLDSEILGNRVIHQELVQP